LNRFSLSLLHWRGFLNLARVFRVKSDKVSEFKSVRTYAFTLKVPLIRGGECHKAFIPGEAHTGFIPGECQ
jgi:hypothetical protein